MLHCCAKRWGHHFEPILGLEAHTASNALEERQHTSAVEVTFRTSAIDSEKNVNYGLVLYSQIK